MFSADASNSFNASASTAVVAGNVVLDFNMAHNPPCAFNPYTTCPLPPEQNRLRVRIPAGEKNYHGKEEVAGGQ